VARLSTTSYAVLGLLSFARQSGYDLAGAAGGSIGHFWPISKTQVYDELRRLHEQGLVAATTAERSGGPEKTLYALTAAGEQALDRWVAEEAPDRMRLRAPALLKLLFGHRAGPAVARDHLVRYRDRVVARADELRRLVARLEDNRDARYAWATALFGLRMCEAIAGWADEVLPRLPKQPIGVDPRRSEPAKAAALLASVRER
jgi:DNA-binding PadR family transcriptional regulator